MFSWLMSKYYDRMLQDAETKCLQDWRQSLLCDLSGDVLELGCGTGANLPFYDQKIRRLVLAEPNRYMRRQLEHKRVVHAHRLVDVKVLDCLAEAIAFPDAVFDAVVSTLVLCSVKDLSQALAEMHRILKPGGKLYFIEHVLASNRPQRLKWQKRIEPFWKMLQCGCHLTRDTERAIIRAGFSIEKVNRQSMRGVPPIVRPSIWGEAVKAPL